MLEQLKWYGNRIYLIIDDKLKGRVDLEEFAGHHVCLHFSLDEDVHRQGWATRMVDMVYEKINNHNLIHWTDDPFYKIEHRRSGIMTEAGRAFADAYRVKRGIPLPNMCFENPGYRYVERRQECNTSLSRRSTSTANGGLTGARNTEASVLA